MLLVKKLIRRPPPVACLLLLASHSYATPLGKGFYLTNEQTKTSILVDTSACRSIHSVSPLVKCHPKDVSLHLVAANSSTIATYKMKTFHLTFSGHPFFWTFILADAKVPLLGADFLTHYQLLVNVICSFFVNVSSYLSVPLQPSSMLKDVIVITVLSNFQTPRGIS